MSEMFNPHAPATAYDHNTTIVAVLELSGKNWLLGAVAPSLSRRTKRSFGAGNVEAVVRTLEHAKGNRLRRVLRSRGSLSVSNPAGTDLGRPVTSLGSSGAQEERLGSER